MDVVNAEQARVAEEAGAVSVMALERIPADIKKDGGIARASDPRLIRGIMDVTRSVFRIRCTTASGLSHTDVTRPPAPPVLPHAASR